MPSKEKHIQLVACPPMMKSTCSLPSNGEDTGINICDFFYLALGPAATIILSIGVHATSWICFFLYLPVLFFVTAVVVLFARNADKIHSKELGQKMYSVVRERTQSKSLAETRGKSDLVMLEQKYVQKTRQMSKIQSRNLEQKWPRLVRKRMQTESASGRRQKVHTPGGQTLKLF